MIGKTVSHYRILEKLGEGGMGVVYRAEDTKLKRTVALKFLSPQALGTEEDKERFLNEAQAAAALNHPHICTVHEIDEVEGRSFIAMELVEGESLRSKISSGPLPLEEVYGLATQIAEGLNEAHRKGIVHRDIKPANIMITENGRVKIMDFGLAKSPGSSQLTQEGTTLGTIAYMSPEQERGLKIDYRTDIWSFGIILYEMVAGRLPFQGDYDQAVIYSILNEEPPPLTSLRTGVPLELERMVNKALAKDPDDRYQHLDEMLVDLRALHRVSGSHPSVTVPAPPERKRRRPLYLFGLLIILVALVLILKDYLPGRSTPKIDSIAVLPLQNLSGDPAQEYFSDGMTEALITELSQIGALRVISRTSVMRYKDSEKSLPEIARELGVKAVVEGSALLAGERIRITAQLIEARTDRHLWARDYERELKDVLSLQKEVARAVAREVRVVLTPEEEAKLSEERTIDPEAQKLFLRGRYHINKLAVQEQYRGIDLMRQVVEKDPGYALAYVAIAEAYNNIIALDGMSCSEGWPQSKKWAERALEIDGSLGEAYAMIADIKALWEWDWEGAEIYYRKALELSPGAAIVNLWYGSYLLGTGRREESVPYVNKAHQLSPLHPGTIFTQAMIRVNRGELEEGERMCREVIEIDPNFTLPYRRLATIYLNQSKIEEGLQIVRESIALSSNEREKYLLAQYYAKAEMEDEARELLNEMLALPEDELLNEYIAATFAQLGESDGAFEYLEKALGKRSLFISGILSSQWWDPIRTDPRFEDLCRRIGFPSAWYGKQ
ncbi:MAG: protein kinase [Candidatus Krumholzibacteriota bacterium]|nr:protein kinase [Candidatus Krumholzibacteriota bacterium]